MSDKDKKVEEDKVLYKGEEMSPKEFAARFEDENKKKERNAESVARQKLEKKQEEESRRKSFVNALIPKEEDKVEDDYGPGSEQEESQPDMSMYRVNLPFDVQEGPNLKLGPIGQQQIPEPEVEYRLGGLMSLMDDNNIQSYKDGGKQTVKSKDGTVTNKFKDKNGNIVTQVKTKDGKYYEKKKSRDQIIADRKKSIETLNQIGLAVKNPIIDMIEPSLDLEEKVEYNLGHPMKKAANIARYKAGEGNDPIDNFRHPMAGRYTAEAAYKLRKENTPWAPEWLNKTGAWIDANTLGVAHEATTLFKDERPWGVKLREAAEDIYNNGVGVNTGLSNSTAREKTNYLLDLSYNNKLPDGYGDQKRPMYFKKTR